MCEHLSLRFVCFNLASCTSLASCSSDLMATNCDHFVNAMNSERIKDRKVMVSFGSRRRVDLYQRMNISRIMNTFWLLKQIEPSLVYILPSNVFDLVLKETVFQQCAAKRYYCTVVITTTGFDLNSGATPAHSCVIFQTRGTVFFLRFPNTER